MVAEAREVDERVGAEALHRLDVELAPKVARVQPRDRQAVSKPRERAWRWKETETTCQHEDSSTRRASGARAPRPRLWSGRSDESRRRVTVRR